MKSLEFMAGKLGKAAAYFLEDEEQSRRRGEREVALARATGLVAEGRSGEAIDELVPLLEETLSTEERLRLLRLLGRAYLEAGQSSKAATVLADALRGYEAVSNAEQIARTRAQLGGALIALRSYSEAEEHLAAALRAAASGVIKDPLFHVHALHNLGVAFYQRGDYRSALENFERAEKEGRDIADQKWLASLFAAMGMSRRQVGDYEGAITYLRKSEALFEAIRNRARVAEIRFQTARALRALGNRTKASAVLVGAGDLARAANARELAVRIEAFEAFSWAEDGESERGAKQLRALVSEADEAGLDAARFVARLALGKVLALQDPAEAKKVLTAAVALVEQSETTGDVAEAYDELSRVSARQGLSDEALAYANKAYRAASVSRKGGV